MICIDNINVHFINKIVFEKQSLTIEQGKITALIGESGAGKTTLLDILALETFNSEVMMFEGTDLRKLSVKEVEKFKEDNIYYVKQSPRFFNDIRLKEYLYMYDEDYQKNLEIKKMIVKLDLMDKLDLYPMQLSGGEKIKFSLLLAYLSRANILILDEPTASLDANSINEVIDVITAFSKLGKYVIYSTHHQELMNLASDVIEIQDGQIKKIKSNNSQSNLLKLEVKHQPKNIFTMLLISRKHHLLKNIFKYLLIAFIMTISLTSIFTNNYAARRQEEIINDLGATEMIIYKPVLESQKDYYTGNYEFPFSQSDIEKIKQIKHIKKVSGYVKMSSNRSNDVAGNIVRQTNYQIYKNGKVILDHTIDFETGEGANTNYNQADVAVYYGDKDFKSSGIYLSSVLANRIGYSYEEGTILKTTVNIPLYNIYNGSYLRDENNNKIPVCDSVGKLVEIELPIYGIIDNYPEWSTKYANNALFIADDIYDKLISENKVSDGFDRDKMQYLPWQYNAYYLKIDSIANFEAVSKQLNELGISYYSEYADAKVAKTVIDKQKDTMMMLSVILMISLFVIVIIFSSVKKKDEADMIDYFKMIGFSKRMINKIRLNNYFIDTMIMIPLVLILMVVVKYVYQILQISYIELEFIMIPIIIVLSILVNVVIPYIVTGRYYDKHR